MVALMWLSMSLGLASEPLEGFWDLVSVHPDDGEVIDFEAQMRDVFKQCDEARLMLRLKPASASLSVKTRCPVPAHPDGEGETTPMGCLASGRLNLTRDGLTLSSHPALSVTATLHRIASSTTTSSAGGTSTERGSRTDSCAVNAVANAMSGTLDLQKDGLLHLHTATGTTVFRRAELSSSAP